MLSLRARLARFLLRDQMEQFALGIEALADMRHWVRVNPDARLSHASRLGEVDNQYLDLILDQSGYVPIGGVSGFQPLDRVFNEQMRQKSVMDARWMYHMDVMTE